MRRFLRWFLRWFMFVMLVGILPVMILTSGGHTDFQVFCMGSADIVVAIVYWKFDKRRQTSITTPKDIL